MRYSVLLSCLFGLVVIGCDKRETVDDIQPQENKMLAPTRSVTKPISDTVRMIAIKGGNFIPFFGDKDSAVFITDFLIDEHPVTIAQYVKFLKANPQWKRSVVSKIYADGNYLIDWLNDSTLSPRTSDDSPVTSVSWFTAKAYCACVGKELPTINQWEYVAAAGLTKADERNNDDYNKFILNWYKSPTKYGAPVKTTYKNYYGVWDVHGLIWEWTYDFNEVMISGESRKDSSNDPELFCGSGSIGANDLMDYAAFMRYAFRGSLKANYSIKNQGFRCAKKVES